MGLLVSKMLDLLLLKRGLKTLKSFKQDFFSPEMPYTFKYLKLVLLHLERVFKTLESFKYDPLHLKCLIFSNHSKNIFYTSREFLRHSNHTN